ncbi:hypothetical protein Hanom_Chr16g01504331 [Helianthus anomalus]
MGCWNFKEDDRNHWLREAATTLTNPCSSLGLILRVVKQRSPILLGLFVFIVYYWARRVKVS